MPDVVVEEQDLSSHRRQSQRSLLGACVLQLVLRNHAPERRGEPGAVGARRDLHTSAPDRRVVESRPHL
jgi:hypothetical protein